MHTRELFSRKAQETAHIIVDEGVENLSDTEVALLHFDCNFQRQVRDEFDHMQENSLIGARLWALESILPWPLPNPLLAA